jgi:hypothetical protein
VICIGSVLHSFYLSNLAYARRMARIYGRFLAGGQAVKVRLVIPTPH